MSRTRGETSENTLSSCSFTPMAEEQFYAVVDHPDFASQDARLIYAALRKNLHPLRFGDHLKRYIYRKAEMRPPFSEVSEQEYLQIIVESFLSRAVPLSFTPTTARPRAMARNWLNQQNVSRNSVLLMGFGLHMNLHEVDDLLTKGLLETRLNLTDPRETVCAYCYAHDLGFHRYQALMEKAGASTQDAVRSPKPVRFVDELADEDALVAYVRGLLSLQPPQGWQETARQTFLDLYRKAQSVADTVLRQEDAEDEEDGETREERTPGDIERILQAGIPKDRHGNLLPMKKSTVYIPFRGWRLTRQRLFELLGGQSTVTRYDLMTLQFFIFSQSVPAKTRKLQYYHRFLDETNRILQICGMAPMYTVNPYESFLLMCILSEDPLGTYSDVVEESYLDAVS